jgi:hypothetical protein
MLNLGNNRSVRIYARRIWKGIPERPPPIVSPQCITGAALLGLHFINTVNSSEYLKYIYIVAIAGNECEWKRDTKP